MPQLHGEDRLERDDVCEAQEPADGDDSSPQPPRRRCSVSARAWGPLSRSRVAAPALADVIVDYATQAASRQQRERRGSRRKICRERGPQLVGAKVNALSGFRTNYQDTRGVVESWRGGRTRSAGQLVETPRGGRRPVRRRRTLGRMRGSRVGIDTGNGGRAPVPFRCMAPACAALSLHHDSYCSPAHIQASREARGP